MPKAIVVGAGVGGLATAIRLSNRGYDVTVFEAQPKPGGKINQIHKDGFRWDMGPSLFTLPHLLDELFTESNRNPSDYYSYTQLPVITKYFYPDGTVINAFQKIDEFIDELCNKLGEDETDLRKFFNKVKSDYDFTEPIFLENPIHKFYQNMNEGWFDSLLKTIQLGAFSSMNQSNKKWFRNAKTVQLFNRYATYNGSNPYRAPATLNVIAHLEHQLGAFFLKDGMYSVTDSLYRLAQELGVQFKCNSKVQQIVVAKNTASGVVVNEQFYSADVVVANADMTHVYRHLMPNEPQPKIYLNQEKSTSALVFYWGMNQSFEALDMHNIFFSDDYQQEFACLDAGEIISDPTVYVYVSSKRNPKDAPPSMENWFVMINVPHNQGQDWTAITTKAKKDIIDKLNRHLNIDLSEHIISESVLSPLDIAEKTLSDKGALYGNASNGIFSAFLRHPNHRSKYKNLYFVGGSVHPGGGIPLCLLSARIVSELIND